MQHNHLNVLSVHLCIFAPSVLYKTVVWGATVPQFMHLDFFVLRLLFSLKYVISSSFTSCLLSPQSTMAVKTFRFGGLPKLLNPCCFGGKLRPVIGIKPDWVFPGPKTQCMVYRYIYQHLGSVGSKHLAKCTETWVFGIHTASWHSGHHASRSSFFTSLVWVVHPRLLLLSEPRVYP